MRQGSHHAEARPVFGQWVIRELRRHGYEVSPGTLYPLLVWAAIAGVGYLAGHRAGWRSLSLAAATAAKVGVVGAAALFSLLLTVWALPGL